MWSSQYSLNGSGLEGVTTYHRSLSEEDGICLQEHALPVVCSQAMCKYCEHGNKTRSCSIRKKQSKYAEVNSEVVRQCMQPGNLVLMEGQPKLWHAGPSLRFWVDSVVAICGAEFETDLDGSPVPFWESFAVKAGSLLTIKSVCDPLALSQVLPGACTRKIFIQLHGTLQ